MSKYTKRNIQPVQIFKKMGLKNITHEEAEKVLSVALNTLIHMKEGDVLETSSGKFSKISSELIYIDTNLEQQQIVDALEKRRIIKFRV